MYADRYTAQRRTSPAGLAMSIGATGLVVLGLATAAPKIVNNHIIGTLIAENIEAPKPPPPIEQPKTQPKASHPQQQIQSVDPAIKTSVDVDNHLTTVDVAPRVDPGPPAGTGDGGGIVIQLPKPPVLIDSRIDSRYAADFQPGYPSSERAFGREGRVVVRVLIGVDGRVHAVEPVSATNDAFLQATRKRAMERWRFKPATRDGVAVESWREMAVRFELQGDD